MSTHFITTTSEFLYFRLHSKTSSTCLTTHFHRSLLIYKRNMGLYFLATTEDSKLLHPFSPPPLPPPEQGSFRILFFANSYNQLSSLFPVKAIPVLLIIIDFTSVAGSYYLSLFFNRDISVAIVYISI